MNFPVSLKLSVFQLFSGKLLSKSEIFRVFLSCFQIFKSFPLYYRNLQKFSSNFQNFEPNLANRDNFKHFHLVPLSFGMFYSKSGTFFHIDCCICRHNHGEIIFFQVFSGKLLSKSEINRVFLSCFQIFKSFP